MQLLEALFLGILQGLTEFIPVSSSGHLILAEKLFNLGVGSLFFDVMLHLGTLLALVVYFWKDLLALLKSVFQPKGDKLWLMIVIGTIPAAILGFFIQSFAETSLRSVSLVAFNLVFVAGVMLVVDRIAGRKGLSDIKPPNALLIGIGQALALIPGVSRSGITIAAGMSQKLTREAAARFSFLLAIPITFGAVIKLLLDAGAGGLDGNLAVFTVGVLSAAASGYLAISWLLKFLSTHRLAPFAYYRIVLAAVVLATIII